MGRQSTLDDRMSLRILLFVSGTALQLLSPQLRSLVNVVLVKRGGWLSRASISGGIVIGAWRRHLQQEAIQGLSLRILYNYVSNCRNKGISVSDAKNTSVKYLLRMDNN